MICPPLKINIKNVSMNKETGLINALFVLILLFFYFFFFRILVFKASMHSNE